MKLQFPSRDFTKNAVNAMNSREILNIFIKRDNWRGHILIKEAHYWPKTKDTSKIDGIKCRPPSALYSWTMIRLSTVHYLALAAEYELQVVTEPEFIVLKYIPL